MMLYILEKRKKNLSFKDIHRNGYCLETMNVGNVEYIYITSIISSQKLIVEKLSTFFFRLYYITKVY